MSAAAPWPGRRVSCIRSPRGERRRVWPRWLSAGRKAYATAVLTPGGSWMPPARRQAQGPRPTPRWLPRPERLSAPGVQSYRRRRLVGVQHRVGCGPRLAIEPLLARGGGTINPAFVERLTLDSRQRVAAIGRRVKRLCQGEAGGREQLARLQV